MPHESRIFRFSKAVLITGIPGVGYETVIRELSKRGFHSTMGDSHGWRPTPQKSEIWCYDLNTIDSDINESAFNNQGIHFVSMGGTNASALLALPWGAIVVLTVSNAELKRRQNSFRKRIGLPEVTQPLATDMLMDYAFRSYTAGSPIFTIKANRSVKEIADDIISKVKFLDVDYNNIVVNLDDLYDEFRINLKMKPRIITKHLYKLVGGNASGKSHVARELRKKGLLAVTGDRMTLVCHNIETKGMKHWNDLEDNNHPIQWGKEYKSVINDDILRNISVIGDFHGQIDTKRRIVEIGILPNPYSWKHYIYARSYALFKQQRSLHFTSYTANVAKIVHCAYIVVNNYDHMLADKIMSIIELCEQSDGHVSMNKS